jgi:dienelactone hydrolase
LIVIVVVALLVAWKPSRVAFQALALVPSVLEVGPQPLDLAPAPSRIDLDYRDAAGERHRGVLWLPAAASADRPVALMVIVYGINRLGLDHPALTRVSDAVARLGLAIYVPDLPSLDQERLDPAEIGRIVAATQTAATRPEIDPARVGLLGISVGGSLAFRAAADPALSDRLDWIASFGAPADVTELVANVVAHAYEVDGQVVAWQPTLLARQVIFEMLLAQVASGTDREVMRRVYQGAFEGNEAPAAPCRCAGPQTADGRAIEAILTAGDLPTARAALAVAPAGVRALLSVLSPVGVADAIHARVYLMHDRGDHHVPIVQAEELDAALQAAGVAVDYREFRLFDHVTPDTTDLVGAAPEIWKLFWYLQALLVHTL